MILQRLDGPPKPTPRAAVFAQKSPNRYSRHEKFPDFCASEATVWVSGQFATSKREADREQAKRVDSELDRPRVRAEEIAAASGQKTRPLDLLTAEPLGKKVLEEMATLSAKPPSTPPPAQPLVAEEVSSKERPQTQ